MLHSNLLPADMMGSVYGDWRPAFSGGEYADYLDRKVSALRDDRPPSLLSADYNVQTTALEAKKPKNRKQRRATPAEFKVTRFRGRTQTEQLVSRLVKFKLQMANVSRYLSNEWRAGMLGQLDFLLDPEEWSEDIPIPDMESFSAFLKFVIFHDVRRRPSLGASPMGRIVASWIVEDSQLYVEFGVSEIQWSASRAIVGRRDAIAGRTSIESIGDYLVPFHPDRWFR